MFLKGGTHLTHRTPKNVRLQRYDHDHVGNRAERVKIVECYGRSKVMPLRGQVRRSVFLYLPLTSRVATIAAAQTLSSSGDL